VPRARVLPAGWVLRTFPPGPPILTVSEIVPAHKECRHGLHDRGSPPVDVETFADRPYFERIRVLATHWAEYGFGTPKMVHPIYIA